MLECKRRSARVIAADDKRAIAGSSVAAREHFEETRNMKDAVAAQDFEIADFRDMKTVRSVHFAPLGVLSAPDMIEYFLGDLRALAQ